MARSKNTKIETPGQETPQDDDSDLIGGAAGEETPKEANTAQELNAATAGATMPEPESAPAAPDVTARNAALSALNAQGFAIISAFEGRGFVAPDGQQLTNSLDFIALVKQATTPTAPAVRNEDGARKVTGAPVLTEHGWHVPH